VGAEQEREAREEHAAVQGPHVGGKDAIPDDPAHPRFALSLREVLLTVCSRPGQDVVVILHDARVQLLTRGRPWAAG